PRSRRTTDRPRRRSASAVSEPPKPEPTMATSAGRVIAGSPRRTPREWGGAPAVGGSPPRGARIDRRSTADMPRAAPGPTDRQEHVLQRVTERAILRARDPTDSEAGEGRPRPKPPWRRSRTASESVRRPWLRIPRRDRRTDRATPRAPPEERTA